MREVREFWGKIYTKSEKRTDIVWDGKIKRKYSEDLENTMLDNARNLEEGQGNMWMQQQKQKTT